MKKINKEKGITLVALIITIIVLLILAVVTISAITGVNIINYAENARDKYIAGQKTENGILKNYEEYLATGGKIKVSLDTAKTKETVFEKDTIVEDTYGNTLKVPAGFKIASDSAENVTGGVVIEDAITGAATNGSQFVWIPVGTVYTSSNKASSETIEFGRYEFDSNNGTPSKLAADDTLADSWTSENTTYGFQELATSTLGNATAKNLSAFKSSVTSNGGYYIGRYEARMNSTTARTSESDTLTIVTCKPENALYNYVTQNQASSLSQAMYTGINSDLVNSYAWDTAIVFIQKFSNNSNYANAYDEIGLLVTTGTPNDTICNINGMASNCFEWTTETCTDADSPCTLRGGYFLGGYLSSRSCSVTTGSINDGFRPLLYW